MTKPSGKKLTKHNDAMRAAVATKRREAHAALERAETAIFERSDRLDRRERDQSALRSESGLGVPR